MGVETARAVVAGCAVGDTTSDDMFRKVVRLGEVCCILRILFTGIIRPTSVLSCARCGLARMDASAAVPGSNLVLNSNHLQQPSNLNTTTSKRDSLDRGEATQCHPCPHPTKNPPSHQHQSSPSTTNNHPPSDCTHSATTLSARKRRSPRKTHL